MKPHAVGATTDRVVQRTAKEMRMKEIRMSYIRVTPFS